jgi:precorrin-3B C17-methyltransferase
MPKTKIRGNHGRRGPGKLFVVGIGPGHPLDRTARATRAIRQSTVVAGYSRYLDRVHDLLRGRKLIASGMTQEETRCRAALAEARNGKTVALISSGDAGIYGMAGLAMEMAAKEGLNVPIEIVPGVTAASTAAARLGAPLMLDFACISLSDLLVPWKIIRQRLKAVAAADLVVALYNPRSRRRVRQLAEAAAILRRHRPGKTPVGIATALGSEHERIVLSDLDHFLDEEIDMRSVVIIGNRSTRRLGKWMVTPRGYRLANKLQVTSSKLQESKQ